MPATSATATSATLAIATALFRRSLRTIRSAAEIGLAAMGSPSSQWARSSASAPAVA